MILEPSTWWLTIRDGKRVVAIRCQNFHKTLLKDHEISSDGQVTSAIYCTECGWYCTGALLKDWEL